MHSLKAFAVAAAVTALAAVAIVGTASNDSAGFPVQFVPAGAPVQLTIVESVPGVVLNCVWQPVGSIYQGNYANPGNRLIVLNQKIQLIGGPPGPCGGTLQFMSFTYQPVVDSSVPGSLPVFVN